MVYGHLSDSWSPIAKILRTIFDVLEIPLCLWADDDGLTIHVGGIVPSAQQDRLRCAIDRQLSMPYAGRYTVRLVLAGTQESALTIRQEDAHDLLPVGRVSWHRAV